MANNIVRDIVKKTNKKIAPKMPSAPEPRPKPAPLKKQPELKNLNNDFLKNFNISKKTNFNIEKNESGSRFMMWTIASVSVVFVLFAFSTLFTKAVVTIYPKTSDFTLDNYQMKAEKDAPNSELSFQAMILSDSVTRSIESSKTDTLEKPSFGTAVIYNNYSKASQQLVSGTRLETAQGKIYKIDKAVIVPGITMSGSEAVPGSVEVLIHASEPGEEYNVPFADFTIPGFKGGPKYEKFYARSKTPIQGGVKGLVYVLDEKDAAKAKEEMTVELREKLVKKAELEVPNGFVLLDDGIYFETVNDSSVLESKESPILFKVEGKLTALILNEAELASKVAKVSGRDSDFENLTIQNLKDLKFSVADLSQISNPSISQINFNLSGASKLVSNIDTDKLKSEINGKRKKEIGAVLKNHPEIDRADVSLKPFWKSTFPEKNEDIEVINTVSIEK